MGEFRGNQHTDNEYDEYEYDDLVADVAAFAENAGRRPTTDDAMESEQLPCLARIYSLTDSWNAVLQDAGLDGTVAGTYGPDEEPKMIEDMQRAFDGVSSSFLSSRQYADHGNYPPSVIKEFFGSWSEACDAAGIECGTKHGKRCSGPRGATLESVHELSVATVLSENDINYVVHPSIDDTEWTGDFHLPEDDIWIEVDGYIGRRPNEQTFEAKLDYYTANGYDYFVVNDAEDLRRHLRRRDVL